MKKTGLKSLLCDFAAVLKDLHELHLMPFVRKSSARTSATSPLRNVARKSA